MPKTIDIIGIGSTGRVWPRGEPQVEVVVLKPYDRTIAQVLVNGGVPTTLWGETSNGAETVQRWGLPEPMPVKSITIIYAD